MPLTNLTTVSSASKGKTYTPKFNFGTRSGTKTLTLRQLMERQAAIKAAQPKHGFLESLKHGFSSAMSLISRPWWAISTGLNEAIKDGFQWHDVFAAGAMIPGIGLASAGVAAAVDPNYRHGFNQGLHARKPVGMGENLSELGLLKGHGTIRGTLGFGLDVITDPTNLLFIAGAPATGGASLAALAAKESLMVAAKAAPKAIAVTAGRSLIKSIPTLADRGGLEAAARILGKEAVHNPEQFKGLATLADYTLKNLDDIASGALKPAKGNELFILQAAAHDEIKRFGGKALQLNLQVPAAVRVGIKKATGKRITQVPLTPASIGGAHIPAPNFARTAAGEGILGAIPGVAKATDAVGKAIVFGHTNRLANVIQLAAKHVTEYTSHNLDSFNNRTFKPFNRLTGKNKLDDKSMSKALDFGEKNDIGPAVIEKPNKDAPYGIERTINEPVLEAAVKHGTLTESEAGFVRAWHSVTENLRKTDFESGVVYEKNVGDKLYIPHIYDKEGRSIDFADQVDRFKQPGFGKERMEKDLTVKDIAELRDKGVYKGFVETDPMSLLAMRSRKSAEKAGDNAAMSVVQKVSGVSMKDMKDITLGSRKLKMMEKGGKLAISSAKVDVKKATDDYEAARKSLAEGKKFTEQQKASLYRLEKNRRSEANRLKKGAAPKAANKVFEASKRTAKTGINKTRKAAVVVDHAKNKVVKEEWKLMDMLTDPKPINPSAITAQIKRTHAAAKSLQAAKKVLRHESRTTKDLAEESNLLGLAADAATKLNETNIRMAVIDSINARGKRLSLGGKDAERAAILDTAAERVAAKQAIVVDMEQEVARISKEIGPVTKEEMKHLPEGMTEIQAAKNADGETIFVPTEIKNAMQKYTQAINGDDVTNALVKVYTSIISKWKVAVTVATPGYRFRNTATDIWNMWLSGVPMTSISHYGGVAAHYMTVGNKIQKKLIDGVPFADLTAKERKIVEKLMEAQSTGIMASLTARDIKTASFRLKHGKSALNQAQQKHLVKAYTTMMTTMNQNVENWARLTHYLYRTEAEGLSGAEAAWHVKAAHFDYEELTPFESKVMKRVLPFYTWTRKNIPFQLQMLVSRPGRYSAYPKFAFEMQAAAGSEHGDLMPDWMSEAGGIPFPGSAGRFFVPNMGPSDLLAFEHPMRLAMGINPVFKLVTDLTRGTDSLTGLPISGGTHPRTPVSGFAAQILGMIPGNPANVGPTERFAGDGTIMSGAGANPYVSYIARQIPFANFMVNQTSSIAAQRQGGQAAALGRFFLGTSMYEVDQKAEAMHRVNDFKLNFSRAWRGLKDENQIPEEEQDQMSEYEKSLQEIIAGGG